MSQRELIRDLDLPKDKSELLAWKSKVTDQLERGTKNSLSHEGERFSGFFHERRNISLLQYQGSDEYVQKI